MDPQIPTNPEPKKAKRTGKAAGGRPSKQPEEKLKSVTTHVSAARYAELKEGAAEVRQPMSQFVRPLVEAGIMRRKRPMLQLSAEQEGYLRQLGGMGHNLNQLTKKAHQEGFQAVENELQEQVIQLNKLLNYLGNSIW